MGLADPTDSPAAADDSGPDWLQVTAGNDNPFFDLRSPGDPGGIGFYKLHTQVQLFDSPNTGCAIAVQAVTPAGRESDGVDDGQTVVSPAVSLFHSLDDGTAIQGFVGKNVNVGSHWSGQLSQSVRYGMAVQRPLLPAGPNGDANFYVFMEALGHYRYDAVSNPGSPNTVWRCCPASIIVWRRTGGCRAAIIMPGDHRQDRYESLADHLFVSVLTSLPTSRERKRALPLNRSLALAAGW